jgi:hypothetical protein
MSYGFVLLSYSICIKYFVQSALADMELTNVGNHIHVAVNLFINITLPHI